MIMMMSKGNAPISSFVQEFREKLGSRGIPGKLQRTQLNEKFDVG